MPEEYEILLVEDSKPDIRLIREAFREAKRPVSLAVARDGKEALDLLARRKEARPVRLPDLVLLDLNMPRLNGREFLAIVRMDPVLKTVPVVILSSSGSADDVGASLALGAKAHVRKPTDLDDLTRVVLALPERWPKA